MQLGKRFIPAALLMVALTAGLGMWFVAKDGEHTKEDDSRQAFAELPEPPFDSMPPPLMPEKPGGSYGFSRYVFTRLGEEIKVTMVEGPRGSQVRCNREDLPCSYLDLKALSESGDQIPAHLQMTPEELSELVAQLDTVASRLDSYEDIDLACADGYRLVSPQVVNMGFHMANSEFLHDGVFDLRQPELLLFAREGGQELNQQELGQCVDGKWQGEPGFQIVGAAFQLPTSQFGEDHPEGFAGPFDNWHVHYHQCLGSLSASSLSKELCEERGGAYIPKAGWMLHTYVVPEFDNQAGVFSMWNPSIWPRMEVSRELATPDGPAAGRESVIFDFGFEHSIKISQGETLTFRNADPFVHSVTAGTPEAPSGTFDSGDLFVEKTFTIAFDRPGEYEFFCRRHPSMTGKVIVK